MSDRPESAAETAYRLQSERECRRIATLIRAELPKNRGFVLLTCDIGKGHQHETFQNTAYVSSLHRLDAAKLLMELIGHWIDSGTLPEEDE